MSLFRKNLDDAAKIMSDIELGDGEHHYTVRQQLFDILNNHLKAVDDEFKVEQNLHEKIKQYYELLKRARALLWKEKHEMFQSQYTSTKYEKLTVQKKEEIKKLILNASELVPEIEKEIVKAHGEAHKFLR